MEPFGIKPHICWIKRMRTMTFLSQEMTEDKALCVCNHREGLIHTGMRVGVSCQSAVHPAKNAQCWCYRGMAPLPLVKGINVKVLKTGRHDTFTQIKEFFGVPLKKWCRQNQVSSSSSMDRREDLKAPSLVAAPSAVESCQEWWAFGAMAPARLPRTRGWSHTHLHAGSTNLTQWVIKTN